MLERARVAETAVQAALRHDRIPFFGSKPGGNAHCRENRAGGRQNGILAGAERYALVKTNVEVTRGAGVD